MGLGCLTILDRLGEPIAAPELAPARGPPVGVPIRRIAGSQVSERLALIPPLV